MRIISGIHKGRRIQVPTNITARPTTDFAKEGLFNLLNNIIDFEGIDMPSRDFYPELAKWITTHHQWDVEENWTGFLPGIVPGLAFAVQCYTRPGDEIIVQPPVYYPFFNVVQNNHRQLVYNQLLEKDGKYWMDFDDLEKKITPKTKLFILCNPHNPGGRVWPKEELAKLAEICEKHNLLVISDEIHGRGNRKDFQRRRCGSI